MRSCVLLGSFFLSISLGSPCSAESVLVVTSDLKRAWFAPKDSGKSIEVDRIVVIQLDGGPVDPPPPTSALTVLSRTWVTKVAKYDKRQVHRRSLEAMYTLLSEQVTSGGIKTLPVLKEATTRARSVLLASDVSEWAVWGRDVGAYLDEHVSTVEQASSAYLEIAAGLGVGEAPSPEFWEFILRIIELILSLLGV